MRKYYFIALVLFGLCLGFIQQQHIAVIAKKNQASGYDWTADANCMGAWFMNNNGGNETDRSGEGETLTQMVGTIPTSSTVPSGYSGTSRNFQVGDTEYLMHATGGSTDISGTALTIVAWVKHDDPDVADMTYVAKYDWAAGHRQYRIGYEATSNNLIGVIGYASGASACAAEGPDSDVDDGNWHHVAMTFDGSDVTLYLDGVEDSNGASNPLSCSQTMDSVNEEFTIGQYATSDYFDGLIDEVAVFDIVLSEAQILGIKNNGISGDKGASD